MPNVLTGVKPTGTPHLGNLLGAIGPAIKMSQTSNDQHVYFIADYHALTSVRDAKAFHEDVYKVAATWMALGLDCKQHIFFKQSDVMEVFKMQWMLSCMTPKGDMNRAHSYKAKIQENEEKQADQDHGVNMGLYSYPILMAADILMYDTNLVPVGRDQQQHVEIARSIAQRINQYYGDETLIEPQEVLQEEGAYVVGLDGRKMSKSYGNTIPLWETEKRLRKLIMKIVTDTSAPEDPKDPNNSTIMDLYKLFADKDKVKALSERYRSGIGWGEAKQELFEEVNAYLSGPREKYNHLLENKHLIDEVLEDGANRARVIAQKVLGRLEKAMTGF